MMGVDYNPRIVTDGLVLALDAANVKSYPGSGTTWADLSGNGRNGTLNGSTNFNTSYFGSLTTPADQITSWIRAPETALQALTDGTIWTLEWAMTILSHSGTRFCQSMATATNNNIMIWEVNTSDMKLWSGTLASGTNPTWTINVPMILTLTRNGNTWSIYKNGIFAAQYTFAGESQKIVEGWVLDQDQDTVLGGFQATQNLNANWHFNRLYNKILTDAEIQQNFNALRGRFGI